MGRKASEQHLYTQEVREISRFLKADNIHFTLSSLNSFQSYAKAPQPVLPAAFAKSICGPDMSSHHTLFEDLAW
jgi:hypothetical protein